MRPRKPPSNKEKTGMLQIIAKCRVFLAITLPGEKNGKDYVGKNIWKCCAWHHGYNGNS